MISVWTSPKVLPFGKEFERINVTQVAKYCLKFISVNFNSMTRFFFVYVRSSWKYS